MAGLIGYNQNADAASTFGGVGDMLGSAILRGAMMRQQAAQRQQELMIEIARLRQEQENAQSMSRYRDEEIGLRKKEGEREDTKLGFAKQKADEGSAEMAVRNRFAKAARTQGLAPSQYQFGDPHMAATKEYDEQKRQGDINEGLAFLSNDPSKGMEEINRMAALRDVGDNPIIKQLIATGLNFHNVPPGNQVMSPGGDVVGQAPFRPPGPARPQAGQDLSANTALTEALKMRGLADSERDPAMLQGLELLVRQALQRQLGTNAPPGLRSGGGQPLTAVNPKTKQRIVSYDNGQTWQPAQ